MVAYNLRLLLALGVWHSGAAGGGRTLSYSCFSAVAVTSGVAISCQNRTIIK